MENQKILDEQRNIDIESRIYEATKERFQLEVDKFHRQRS